MNEESIFLAALEKGTPAERQEFLAEACGADVELRARVQLLLNADAGSSGILDCAVLPGADRASVAASPAVGTVLNGRYILLEEIGEGGMGSVWVAEQTEPVRRKVALKFIKLGMDSQDVLARFEAERQALALMDHPNIAKVLDGGLTETGRPYFVMEYVKGVPITESCDASRLSVPERLELFAQVCGAVQHAHQKGVIHRDLKPSNVLVAPYDDKPVPKVIDFGLAKAMYGTLTDRTLHTAHETVLGTPLYMSPEQAQLNNLDVDTRSDIYSLGVLLYELLTGTTPLERQRFKEADWDEIRRLIREEEPPRPSTRLSSIATLPSLAACRKAEPAGLTKLVRGELDWIVMKALEKDRNRRYDTANSFARDVQRFLEGEPVQAVPPSAAYRVRKFARKHRVALTTGVAITFLLVAGIAVSTWQAVRATDAEARAQTRLAQIEKGNEILLSIFSDLDWRAVKQGTEPLEAVLAGRLVKAAEQLEGEAVGDPRAVARLQNELAHALRNLGYVQEAIPLFLKARATYTAHLGPDHPDTLESNNILAVAYMDTGKLDLALPLYVETLNLRKTRLGANHRDTLISMHDLALCYREAGKLDLALPLLEESFGLRQAKLGADHLDTLMGMANLAGTYREAGKLDLALPLSEEVFKRYKAKLGADHPDTLMCMNNLAVSYREAGKLDLALPLYVETLKLRKAKLGASHPGTLMTMVSLGTAYRYAGKLDLALPLLVEARDLFKAKLGADHPQTLSSMNSLAWAYRAAGKLDLALPLARETALSLEKRRFEHVFARLMITNLIDCHEQLKQFDQAEAWRRKWLAVVKAQSGADSTASAGELAALGSNLLQQHKWTDAETVLRAGLAIREQKEAEAWTTFETQSLLGGALLGQQKYAAAEPLLRAGYEGLKQRQAQIPPEGKARLTESLERLVQLADALEKTDESAKWRKELQSLTTPPEKPTEP